MPRSKNPNPRQVMEEEGADAAAPCKKKSKECDDDGCRDESASQAIEEANDHLQTTELHPFSSANQEFVSPSKCESRDYLDSIRNEECDFKSDTSDCDGPAYVDTQMQPKTSSNFSRSSPPSFFSISSISGTRASSKGTVLQKNVQNPVRKAKCGSPGVFNPNIMTWMRNRFHMRPGGRISASDIISLYDTDTKHLENPPPGLQNYQVGQLLRRVFPSITRCKITVNGKRHWVYKHLNLVENPPEDLFEERNSPNSELGDMAANIADSMTEDKCRDSESPVSNAEEDLGNDTNSPSPSSVTGEAADDDEERKGQNGNAILLGLLGKKMKTEPPSPLAVDSNTLEICSAGRPSLPSGDEMANVLPKKKRDSEVIQWLRDNYKFKAGYFVKSMDLLRKYNNGRAEMVKYLSQVGRVMKNVFPSVRHLRKSFKGGKREWVYLNLKPVDVDSDSEEGKSMLMPTMRRSLGWSGNSARTSAGANRDWRNSSLSLDQAPNAVFKSKDLFHRTSQTEGSKFVIRRSLPLQLDGSSRADKTACEDGVSVEAGELGIIRSKTDKPANKKRIVLYNKMDIDRQRAQDEDGVPIELEQDIFAPFSKVRQVVNGAGPGRFQDKNLTRQHRNEVPVNSGAAVGAVHTPLDMNTRKLAGDDVSPNQGISVLDLTTKRAWSNAEESSSASSPGSPSKAINAGQEALNLTLSCSASSAASPALTNGEVSSSQTIHYRPSNVDTLPRLTSSTDTQLRISQVNSDLCSHRSIDQLRSVKRKYLEVNGRAEDGTPISWQSLQSYSAQKYGWLRATDACNSGTRNGGSQGLKGLRFVEWFFFSGQWLVNKQRALREVKIYEDWTVVIHALGRRVYPNDLGGITDLEKTTTSLNKVFRVLAEAKLCMGFPAPSVSDLYIHGILVSKFEVWSSREDSGEDIRQRAVNCQILYSGPSNCCNKCARILKLHQQQRKGQSFKRLSSEPLPNAHYQPKKTKL